MSYTLHYAPGTASMPVHWMLIELGVPFELCRVDLEGGAQRSADFLRLNPAGRVPVLVVDGVAYTESVALLMLLAERHPQAGLAPPPGSGRRAHWLELMVFLANGLLPAVRDWFYAEVDGAAYDAAAVKALAQRRIENAWQRLDGVLADGRAFLVDDRPGAVDFLAYVAMRWSHGMPAPASNWKQVAAYASRMGRLPSFDELVTREGLGHWRK
jgi:glutathione S-transferase